jgi:ubiquinone/menaquinone biosynthesis C-methylase UbiE
MRPAQRHLASWDPVWRNDRYGHPALRAARARQKNDFFARAGLVVGAEDVVLDVGCGAGDVSLELLRRGAAARQWLAVDDSLEACEKAARAFRQAGVSADVRRADARRLPFDDAAATVAIASGVLEHIRDERTAVGEIARVLQPAGQLVVVTSHRNSLVDLERRVRQMLRIWPYGYQFNHSVASLQRLLAPWFTVEDVHVGQTAWDFPTAAAVDRLLRTCVSRPWGRYLTARGVRR